MTTLLGDVSDSWQELRQVWPSFDWSSASYLHGAFHHIAILAPTTVVRVSTALHHRTQVERQCNSLKAVNCAAPGIRIPQFIDTFVRDQWSAMACSFIRGAHLEKPDWRRVRDPLAEILAELRATRIPPSNLPPVRAWSGGDAWPTIVEKMTTVLGADVRKQAQRIVADVLDLADIRERGLVHGDFGMHNLLWDGEGAPGLIDLDNACVGDPAIDFAPLVGQFGAARVADIADADVLERARIYRASLPLQVAAAADFAGDFALRDHALRNFAARAAAGSLYGPS